ncbi:hypothetical protein [Aeoliella mucimassa]|uniref:Uncharacterized protein n=1 Tax=Aeoliella mucimassa TaxID=2527972 RepID=A0A518AR68_9BACT|nr:hypothetical protein [Aeoliella mucimassa]QDU57222.1 hypothetical protein Pan181_34360 [Aeoliella mucimassa]
MHSTFQLLATLTLLWAHAAFASADSTLLFVNQCGYQSDWPKRFTAIHAEPGQAFVVQQADTGEVLYSGALADGVGDFSDYRPNKATTCVIRTNSSTSDPFVVSPDWAQDVCYPAALHFMVDTRSVVGTHPSAYGGGPWRDSTYYTFEMPSLVLLYLSNPDYFQNLPIEINYARDKQKVLASDFEIVRANGDDGALETARRYYQEIDPPVGDNCPDIVQLMHWGVGWYLLSPATKDPSNDPLPRQIHPQTVEQFAFFLYALPEIEGYFTDSFKKQAHDFAFDQWESVGLLDVITDVGTLKGRHCPGHSIQPNLLMHEVAKREGRADAKRFLQAAVEQAHWVITHFDAADPRVTKGQRMSEHKLIMGLVTLQKDYPESAPEALNDWLRHWTDVVIARSDNLWDFRRYTDTEWSIPRSTGQQHSTSGAAGWNEPGNLAAFPGICMAVADLDPESQKSVRLRQIGIAQLDNLFGRNPLAAHTAALATDPEKGFAGAERGWPKHFHNDTCARLELVRRPGSHFL